MIKQQLLTHDTPAFAEDGLKSELGCCLCPVVDRLEYVAGYVYLIIVEASQAFNWKSVPENHGRVECAQTGFLAPCVLGWGWLDAEVGTRDGGSKRRQSGKVVPATMCCGTRDLLLSRPFLAKEKIAEFVR